MSDLAEQLNGIDKETAKSIDFYQPKLNYL
jgi:hypothetical protein